MPGQIVHFVKIRKRSAYEKKNNKIKNNVGSKNKRKEKKGQLKENHKVHARECTLCKVILKRCKGISINNRVISRKTCSKL